MKILNVKNGNRTLKNHAYVDGRSLCGRVHISDKHTITGEAETVECKYCAEQYAEYKKLVEYNTAMLQVQNIVKSTEPTDVNVVLKNRWQTSGQKYVRFEYKNVVICISANFVGNTYYLENDRVECFVFVDDAQISIGRHFFITNLDGHDYKRTCEYAISLMHYMIRTYTDYTETVEAETVEAETVEAETVETETVETETVELSTEAEHTDRWVIWPTCHHQSRYNMTKQQSQQLGQTIGLVSIGAGICLFWWPFMHLLVFIAQVLNGGAV